MKAIIFDLDGTITNSERLHLKTFKKKIKEYGIKVTKKEWPKFRGKGSKYFFQYFFSKYNINESVSKAIDSRSKYFEEEIKKGRLKSIKGFKRFYNKLKKRNVKIIIASSGHYTNVLIEMKSIGIADQAFVCEGNVKRLKPWPDIFLLAAKKLKEKPSNCIVFEDSTAGIKAAKKAGMKVVGVAATSNKDELDEADLIIKDYNFFTKKELDKLLN